MAVTILSVDFASLNRAIAHVLNWPAYASWSAAQLATGGDILEMGLNQFYSPPPLQQGGPAHRWTFMYPTANLTTSASYSTGTVEIVSGVVALSVAGTFPSWAATGELLVGGVTYTVASRGGDNEITLDDTTDAADADAGTSYELARPIYDLPSDFAEIEGPFTYRPGTAVSWRPIRIVSIEQIHERRQWYDRTSYPRVAAVVPKAFVKTVGQQWEVHFDPMPDAIYQLQYRYRVTPYNLDATDKYAMGGQVHAETIRASVMAAAETHNNDEQGVRWNTFMSRLSASIAHDQGVGPETLGVERGQSYPSGDGDYIHRDGDEYEYEGHTRYPGSWG